MPVHIGRAVRKVVLACGRMIIEALQFLACAEGDLRQSHAMSWLILAHVMLQESFMTPTMRTCILR